MPSTRSTPANPSSSSPPPPPPTPPAAPSSRRRPSLPPIQTTTAALSTATPVPGESSPVSARLPGGAASATTTAASPSFAGGGAVRDDIEMDSLVAGHRRRKSSLMSPSGQAAPPSSGRPRSQSLLNNTHSAVAGSSLPEGPEISEESGFVASPTPSKHEHDSDSFSDEDLRDDEETGLTGKEKRRKQKKKRRNTRLDQRIAQEKALSPEEQKEADKNVIKRVSLNVFLILLWYLFSLAISLYNKWMFDEDRLNFAFPLFTTSMHMLVQFGLASLVLYFVPNLRPTQAHESDKGRSRHEAEPTNNNNNPIMTKMFYFTRIGPCGAATGLDIGLGNTSLKFISLTFYTMCKSSSLAFVLLFAFLFRLETPTWRLVAIIATMTVGVVLMVFGEVEFRLGGFILVISAAFFSGFRWGLTQILLLRHPATSNPISSIFFLTPIMFLTLFGLAIPVEGFGPLFEGLGVLSREWGVILTPLFLLFPGCLAFLMTSAEFALLQRTSVVTLSIAGIFKEVVTIMVASVVFEDKLTIVNFIGLITTMGAIVAYNYIKITKMRKEARTNAHDQYEHDLSLPSSNTGSDVDDDGHEETTGLLRPSVDMSGDALVTSDGDIQPNLLPNTATHEKEASIEKHHD